MTLLGKRCMVRVIEEKPHTDKLLLRTVKIAGYSEEYELTVWWSSVFPDSEGKHLECTFDSMDTSTDEPSAVITVADSRDKPKKICVKAKDVLSEYWQPITHHRDAEMVEQERNFYRSALQDVFASFPPALAEPIRTKLIDASMQPSESNKALSAAELEARRVLVNKMVGEIFAKARR